MPRRCRAAIAAALFTLLTALPTTPLAVAQLSVPPVQVAEPGPTGRRVSEGVLLANYHPGVGERRRPALLLLGGSEGGLSNGTARIAQMLQAEGYAVLHLSYFRAPGQPAVLERIPLELFDEALAWLKAQPEVDAGRLGIIGGSKGAEAALLVATRNPDIRAVVAGMPSSVVWPGVDWERSLGRTPDSSWSAGGKPLPRLPLGGAWRMGGTIADLYAGGLERTADNPDAVIPVERARAAILLICGEADTLWPACPMARQIQDRAKAAGGPAVELLAYKDAGHAVFGVPVPADHPRYASLATLGGTADGNGAARQDSWPRMLTFLAQSLRAAP